MGVPDVSFEKTRRFECRSRSRCRRRPPLPRLARPRPRRRRRRLARGMRSRRHAGSRWFVVAASRAAPSGEASAIAVGPTAASLASRWASAGLAVDASSIGLLASGGGREVPASSPSAGSAGLWLPHPARANNQLRFAARRLLVTGNPYRKTPRINQPAPKKQLFFPFDHAALQRVC